MEAYSRTARGKKVLYISLFANLLLAVLKIIIGVIATSSALLADGFHSFSDMITSLGVLIAVIFANKPPDHNHHYGHGQAEPLAASLLGVVLVLTAAGLGYNMIGNLLAGEISLPGWLAAGGALLSLAVKEILYRYSLHVGKETNNEALIADAWHHRSDALSSIAALVGIFGARLGFKILDPLAGLLVAVLVLKVGFEILQKGFVNLLGRAPHSKKMKKLEKKAKAIEGVKDVIEIKARYHGADLFVDLKITVNPDITVCQGHDIASVVKQELIAEYPEAREVLVHVEPADSS